MGWQVLGVLAVSAQQPCSGRRQLWHVGPAWPSTWWLTCMVCHSLFELHPMSCGKHQQPDASSLGVCSRRQAGASYIRISESEIADDYPEPQQYSKVMPVQHLVQQQSPA